MIFGIAGPSASGKTTVTKILTEAYQAHHMRYSSVLSEIAKKRGLDPTDKATLQDLYVSLRQERGEDWLSKEILEQTRDLHTKHIIIEGNRRKVDLETLKSVATEHNEELKLIFIDASVDTRFKRYNDRLAKQGKPTISKEEFIELESNPAEDEVDYLRSYIKEHGLYIDTDELNVEQTKQYLQENLGF